MGHTLVTIKIQNAFDWAAAQDAKGRKARPIRTVIIPDALVDTGTTYLCLPTRYIKELGLRLLPRTVRATTAVRVVERQLYAGALLTIEDRTDEFSVLEVPDEAPALVGVIPLEALDYMVDPTTQKLVGKHGATRVVLLY
jgi:predicted aspartyl protease